ncbi:MAG: hypothetical protein K8T20_20930 [Planctomycetes bacterium]|nr:hypothetical protein [Planctomycetota bacterium]
MKRLTWVAVFAAAVVLSSGCKRHHHGSGAAPLIAEPAWPSGQVFVDEGTSVTVTLTIDDDMPDPTTIALSSDDTTRVTLPASVTFPAHVTSKSVTITTIADADAVESIVLVTATGTNSSSVMGVRMQEVSLVAGASLGPVAAGTNRAFLVSAGPDGIWATADDRLTVVNGVGLGVPTFLHVTIGAVTPGLQAYPVVTGVSDTALVLTNGPDTLLGTADDRLVQVGGISGGAPSVTASLTVGRMEASEGRRPLMVGTRAVMATRGADLLTNGDDALLVIDGLGTAALTSSSIATPGLAFEAPSIPVVVDATTVLLHQSGADNIFGTIDDLATIVKGIGGAPTVTSVAPPTTWLDGRMGQPVLVGPTTAVYLRAGLDGIPGNADDDYAWIHDILTLPSGAFIAAGGGFSTDPEANSVATGGDGVLIPMKGADLADFTTDDEVLLATLLSTPVPPAPTTIPAGHSVPGPQGRLRPVSSTTAVRINSGTDTALGTTDDAITILTALGGAGASSILPTGALQAALPLVDSATEVVVVGEGADQVSGTADDVVRVISGIGTSPVATTVYTGTFRLSGPPALVANGATNVLLARTAGSDGAAGTADDVLLVSPIP